MSDMTQLPEAPISLTTKVKSPNGFEHLLTLRNGVTEKDFAELMTLIVEKEKVLLAKGWTPLAQNSYAGKGPQAPVVTKPCPVHKEDMKQKISKKTGKPYFSHSKGVYPDLSMCFGSGYPEDHDMNGGQEGDGGY